MESALGVDVAGATKALGIVFLLVRTASHLAVDHQRRRVLLVRSMVTLSAVIFLVTPVTQLAAVSVLLLDDSGNQNQAAAFSACIMLVVAVALIALRGALRLSGRKDVSLIR